MMIEFNDWLAICETKARYCRLLDAKDWAGWADCFTEDFTLQIPGAEPWAGRDLALGSARKAIETAVTVHQVHNPEIVLRADGNSADVTWALQDRVLWPQGREAGETFFGHTGYGNYREVYVRCGDGRWRIRSTVLTYLYRDLEPAP